MSKKRTSDECNYDDQTNEGSDSLCQNEDSSKRIKLDTMISDTTLQDLPIELLQCIIVKAVAMEVTSLKLAKAVWKEKADLVINRLMTVCSQWSSILTTNSFRAQLHRSLDGTAQVIRVEMLEETPILPTTETITAMNNEVFILSNLHDQDYGIYVFNRADLAALTDVISLPEGSEPVFMTACNVSNCLYVGVEVADDICLSVLRVSKTGEHHFNITEVTTDQGLPIYLMSVSANGSLIILTVRDTARIHMCDANGSLQHEITLPQDLDVFGFSDIIPTTSGNLVVCHVDENDKAHLYEIDVSGCVLRQYQPTRFSDINFVHSADNNGRIMITGSEGICLLDSELNLLGSRSLVQDCDNGKNLVLYELRYDRERNEIMRVCYDDDADTLILTVFRITVE